MFAKEIRLLDVWVLVGFTEHEREPMLGYKHAVSGESLLVWYRDGRVLPALHNTAKDVVRCRGVNFLTNIKQNVLDACVWLNGDQPELQLSVSREPDCDTIVVNGAGIVSSTCEATMTEAWVGVLRELYREKYPTTPSSRPKFKQVVVAAAVRSQGVVFVGARHYDRVMCAQMDAAGFEGSCADSEQGFIDNRGQFLTREAALVAAKAAGQIGLLRETEIEGNELMSEHLY